MIKKSAFQCVSHIFVFIVACCSLFSCVDKDYEIESFDDISKEITVATDGIVAPVLASSRQTISGLLGKDADEYLKVGQDGVYVLNYGDNITARIEDLVIDPITDFVPEIESHVVHLSEDDIELPATVKMKPVSSSFELDIPDFNIKNTVEIPDVEYVSSVRVPEGVGSGVTVNPSVIPQLSLSVHDRSSVSVSAELEDEIAYVKRVEFGKTEAGDLVTMFLDAGNFEPIYGGGTVESLTVAYPAGYELGLSDDYGGKAVLSKGTGSQTYNVFTLKDYAFSETEMLQVQFCMLYVELPSSSTVGGVLTVEDGIDYDLNFTMKTKAGTVGAGKGPGLGIKMSPVFRDALVMSNDIRFDVTDLVKDFDYDIPGVSTDISNVDYVALSGTNTVTLKASPLNLPFEGADFNVNVALPKVLIFEPSPYIVDGNTLSAPYSVLSGGVTLNFAAIDLGGSDKGAVDENGVIKVHEQLKLNVSHTFPAAVYRLSEIADAMGKQTCELSVSAVELKINRVGCVFTLKSISSDINITENFDYSLELPDEIKSIDRLYIETLSGDKVSAEVKFSVSDSPVENVFVENLVVTLPDMIMLSGDDVVDNRIEISGRQIPAQSGGEVLLTEFEITGLKNLPVQDGHIVIDDAITFTGKVRTIDGEIIEGLNSDVTITPVVSVPDIKVVKFEGRVDVNLNDYMDTPTVDLTSLTDELEDISLGLVDPSITVAISNPVGVALNGNIVLHPFDKAGKPMEDLVIRDIHVAGADDKGDAVTKLFITPIQGAAMSGHDVYCVPELLELLRNLPSKIDIDLQVALDEKQTHSLFLDRDYDFEVEYDINVPLRLDSSTRISYSDAISLGDVFEDITDKDIKVGTLELMLEVRSTVPLALDLQAELRDEKGASVDGVEFKIDGRIEGYDPEKDGTEKVSKLSAYLKLRDGNVDWLGKADNLRLDVKGFSSSPDGLRPEQYIDIKAYVRARKITIDLDKF